jgi:hypothetical protein
VVSGLVFLRRLRGHGAAQGYSKWTYRFQPDRTYTFVSEFWSMSTNYREYWFVEESGTYEASANIITLKPAGAERILRNKEGQVQSRMPAPLEPASYRYGFHYFEGLGEWNLVLTPTEGRETRRDGTFSSNAMFPKSYLHGDPPPR